MTTSLRPSPVRSPTAGLDATGPIAFAFHSGRPSAAQA
jgi:hypothetical protein